MKLNSKYYFGLLLLLIGFLIGSCPETEKTNLDYVNPFICTVGHGHTYPCSA